MNQYKEVSRTGLEKFDDISYLNATLQSLGQIKDFANYFLRKDIQKEIESNIRDKPLAFVTERLFMHLYPYPPKPKIEIYKLRSYMKVLKSLNCYYNNNKRRNVNEVLIFILDALHNELRGDNNVSIISENVTFKLRNEINCNNCGYSSCRRMTFNTFDLDIYNTYKICKKDINIYNCLDYWQSNNYPKLYCYNCRYFTPRNKISKIESTPKVFIFLLQRGINFDQDNMKMKINFILDEQINISNYTNEGLSNKYELTGIVSIYAANKKYICYCKSPIDHQWYCFNDAEVNCILLRDIINHSYCQRDIPCILYYTKKEN